jgi:hypothetical protein
MPLAAGLLKHRPRGRLSNVNLWMASEVSPWGQRR